MPRWRGLWGLMLGLGGCCASAPVSLRPASPSAAPVAIELPLTKPIPPDLNASALPGLPARAITGPEGTAFRRLTESDCLLLAAAHTSAANSLDEENRIPPPPGSCTPAADQLRQTVRYHTALELRNRAAADALDRLFQLADAEARTELLRNAFPIIDPLLAKARDARAQNVRFPLEVADLERQRSQLLSQLEQAELGSRLVNLDLKRRLGLPYQPAEERLWPAGDFAIDPAPSNLEESVAAALADRPELRGLRALHEGLTLDTLPDAREILGVRRALPVPPSTLLRLLHRNQGPDPAAAAELEIRRQQLADFIADRERAIADETRAAALAVNSQRVRAALARDRFQIWDEKLTDAVKKREANQPGAEFLEPQVRLEWLKAKAEVAAEVAAWHQARIRLKAAMGWLAWEAAGRTAPGR